jgi:hypothetical protein
MSLCDVKADENDLVSWRFLPGAILGGMWHEYKKQNFFF